MKFKVQLFLTLTMSLFISAMVQGQKAKFKSQVVNVQKIKLPTNYIIPENRTYTLLKKGTYAQEIALFENVIHGWEVDEESPRLKGVISVHGINFAKPQKQSEKKEKKDKDGKVTDSWTEYYYTGSATGSGRLALYGVSNPFGFETKYKRKSKSALKREAAEAEKAAELESNPFLSSADIADAEENASEEVGLNNDDLTFIQNVSLNQSESVKTGNHRSSSNAYKEYTGTQRPKLETFRNNYPSMAYSTAMRSLNDRYGYAPTNYRFYMKNMKSDKHPEFSTWNSACQATVTLFKAFKPNELIDDRQAKFDPIIDYFQGILNNTSDGDKKAKKLRTSAFINLVNIMYFLDRHEGVEKLCAALTEEKFLGKNAQRYLEKSERLAALLEFHSMSTCHIESNDEVDMDDFGSEEFEDTVDSGGQ